MSLITTIEDEIKEAMKARDAERRDALRLIVNALKGSEKELQRPLSDDEELQVLQRERKKRVEAADAFRTGGREEQAAAEERELAILEEFMPEPLSEDEIEEIVDDAIAEVGATSMADLGRVMADVMPQIAGRADGSASARSSARSSPSGARGALAGALAAAAWQACDPMLKRTFGTPYCDAELIGPFITRGRYEWLANLVDAFAAGAVFGYLFERLGGRGVRRASSPRSSRTPCCGRVSLVFDRIHPKRRDGTWPQLSQPARLRVRDRPGTPSSAMLLGALSAASEHRRPKRVSLDAVRAAHRGGTMLVAVAAALASSLALASGAHARTASRGAATGSRQPTCPTPSARSSGMSSTRFRKTARIASGYFAPRIAGDVAAGEQLVGRAGSDAPAAL